MGRHVAPSVSARGASTLRPEPRPSPGWKIGFAAALNRAAGRSIASVSKGAIPAAPDVPARTAGIVAANCAPTSIDAFYLLIYIVYSFAYHQVAKVAYKY